MSETIPGLVSYVVPTYNYGSFVAGAITSLLNQTYEQIEVIVVDDASTDDTQFQLSRFSNDARVRIIRHERNEGHIASYNEGLSEAAGEFIGLLSADDFISDRSAVELMINVFRTHSSAGFVYAAHEVVDADGRRLGVNRPASGDYIHSGELEFSRLAFQNYVSHSGTLVRRSCHGDLGWYEPTLPHSADWDLWLRLSTRFSAGYIAKPLFAYRIHGANMSHTQISPGMAMDELRRVLDRNFQLLTPDGQIALMDLRDMAGRHAMLFPVWLDLGFGRRRRATRGLVAALARSPSLVRHRPFWGAVRRTFALVVLRPSSYRERFGGFTPQAS